MCSREVATSFAERYDLDASKIHICAVHHAPESVRSRLRDSTEIARRNVIERTLSGRKIVLYVGRLAPVKNLPVAVRAFAAAFKGNSTALFAFVGTGTELEALATLGEELGISHQMLFVGHQEREELYAWYRIASMLILTSVHEPYGAVVNEALICGVPVACSITAGASRLIREGANGYQCPPNDSEAFATAMHRLWDQSTPADELVGIERPDLMPLPFSDDVDGFLAAVELALRQGSSTKGSSQRSTDPLRPDRASSARSSHERQP
jgi:glycosyltransferase involved in cell wall biosynthesis